MTILSKKQREAFASGGFPALRALEQPKRSPLPRPAKRIARSPIKPTKRTAAEQRAKFLREFGGQARHDWVETLQCVARSDCPCSSINAHVAKCSEKGTGRKGGYKSVAPLCWSHHAELHDHGPLTFEAKYKIRLDVEAARVQEMWRVRCLA